MSVAKIMVVEDNITVAMDLSDCIRNLGFSATEPVASGEEAIATAEAERPDVVVMDIRLRGQMDGIEAAAKIYDRFEIPVVFLSAYSDRSLLDKAKRVGSFGYLVKPYDERELLAALEISLYRSKIEKENKQLEVRLRQMRKMEGLRVMAGSIAHNFNNLLQGVLGYTELAMNELPADSKAKTFLELAEMSTRRAAEMSTLMLLYVGQERGELEDIRFLYSVRQSAELFSTSIRKKIAFKMNLVAGNVIIKANPVQFQNLIVNLLTNAVEAIGDEEGNIVVAAHVKKLSSGDLAKMYFNSDLPPGEYAALEVTDSGCGIDEETLEKIFDPFFTTKFTGRGLGLATVIGAVRIHNGAVDVHSKPGQGTTITVLFPVSEMVKDAELEQPAASVECRTTGTILLVDDEQLIRDVGSKLLQRAGHTVMLASSGTEAVEVFRKFAHQIDCVLLDLTMPENNGDQVYDQLRGIDPEAKIILSTGYEENDATKDFDGKDLAGFLRKPYNSQTLESVLNSVLSQKS